MRRYISLLIVLVCAGSISWWSAKKETGVAHHIQDEVTKLVPLFVSDPDSIDRFVIDPILKPILTSSLQLAVSGSEQQHQDIVVIVTDGDDDSYGDGTATHVATLQINHQPVAGLRIICSSETDSLLIAGVFTVFSNKAISP
jgi:hypothetical protein